MVRMVLVWLLVAALLGGAANVAASSPPPAQDRGFRSTSQFEALQQGLFDQTRGTVAGVGGLVDGVDAPEDPTGVLECTTVVRVTLTRYEGHVEDTRAFELGFLSDEVLRQLIGYDVETVTSLLSTINRMVPIVQEIPVDLAVGLEWHEDYMVWEAIEETYWLALPVGLPLAESGVGEVVEFCGAEQPVVSDGLPSWADVLGLQGPPGDGWIIRIDSVTVSLADTPEEWALPEDPRRGFALNPQALSDRVRQEIDSFRAERVLEGKAPSSSAASWDRSSVTESSNPMWATHEDPVVLGEVVEDQPTVQQEEAAQPEAPGQHEFHPLAVSQEEAVQRLPLLELATLIGVLGVGLGLWRLRTSRKSG